MNSNLSIMLLIVVLALALIARCDVRHAIGRINPVPQIQRPGSNPDPGQGSAMSLQVPRLVQEGAIYGPATEETSHQGQG